IAVDYDSVHGSTADLICVISYGIKKRATPAGGCSPIAIKTVSKRYKRRGSICAISYAIKKVKAIAL
ncbi:MAG: hypothetical protein IKM00_02785, partial [Clostridia bacterium]|nr:hypothetical protein [Clostridia bacterium]